MIKFLASNHRPLKTNHSVFYDEFYELFAKAEFLRIGVGYITRDSLAELLQTISRNRSPIVELVIGMHHFQGFEKPQFEAAKKLNSFLIEEKLGGVFVSTQFPYHGKVYTFADASGKAFAGIVGSNNLSSIVESTDRIYESAICVENDPIVYDLDIFIQKLIKTCSPIEGLNTRLIQSAAPLENLQEVEKVEPDELVMYEKSATNVSFQIPLKASKALKSNLNPCFGKGRLNKKTGIEIPRPWYEAEIIVSKSITTQPGYPNPNVNNGVITVITDDGWRFICKVSGDYNKNLRSEGSLAILGRWIKGRLENEGLLTPGEVITDRLLDEYGRNSVDLIKTKEENIWLLKFNKPK